MKRSMIHAAVATTLTLALASCGTSHKTSTSTTTKRSKVGSSTTTSQVQATTTTSPPEAPTTTTTPPSTTSTTASFIAGAACASAQLNAIEGPGGVGLGSETLTIELKNTSNVECYLQGYPGLQMLSASGQLITTNVHWGSSVSVPSEPVTKVSITPGATVYFLMGFTLGTGYGTEQCPTAQSLEVTPPNDKGYLKLSATLTPYGGTVQNLQCGDITASPVIPSLPAGF